MTVENAFKRFPSAQEVYEIAGEVFLKEEDANSYSKHFNLGKPTPIKRPEVKPAKKEEVKKTETTDPKSGTTDEGTDKTETK